LTCEVLLRRCASDCRGHAESFERLVALVWQRQGYTTRLTPQSGDRGVDIYATRRSPGGSEQIAIQCKLQSRPVSREVAQRLNGEVHSDPSLRGGVIVTNNDFTRDCLEWARGVGAIQLVNGRELCEIADRLGIGGDDFRCVLRGD